MSGLSFEELASFPLEDFFDHYERGLKKVSVALAEGKLSHVHFVVGHFVCVSVLNNLLL